MTHKIDIRPGVPERVRRRSIAQQILGPVPIGGPVKWRAKPRKGTNIITDEAIIVGWFTLPLKREDIRRSFKGSQLVTKVLHRQDVEGDDFVETSLEYEDTSFPKVFRIVAVHNFFGYVPLGMAKRAIQDFKDTVKEVRMGTTSFSSNNTLFFVTNRRVIVVAPRTIHPDLMK